MLLEQPVEIGEDRSEPPFEWLGRDRLDHATAERAKLLPPRLDNAVSHRRRARIDAEDGDRVRLRHLPVAILARMPDTCGERLRRGDFLEHSLADVEVRV